ncbi:MAG TPA: AAA family ATPase [Runella sp.]|nr:AAA family ATPase [Runella sp.]HAO51516.1 AAA family ATPase [Runella sp.]
MNPMRTPEDFPYITNIHVNDCYTYQNFDILLNDDKPFSHLVLTGRNGSGKSTILSSLDSHLFRYYSSTGPSEHIHQLEGLTKANPKTPNISRWKAEIQQIKNIAIGFNNEPSLLNSKYITYSFLKSSRQSKPEKVTTVTQEIEFLEQLNQENSSEFFVKQFKQYLVNKKVNQAFDILDNNKEKIAETERFFQLITNSLQRILEDSALELVFMKENFDFEIQLSSGQRITFDHLSDGFSALVSILMDLFMRVDIIRKEVKDFSYNPCGIVLIDEPETHLHLKLQYEVMPLLTSLFPNIQFVVATHSPAVVSSLQKATIFDLTTKTTESERVVGSSFSELMVSHFGLENEYSNIADDIFEQINHIVKTEANPQKRKERLQEALTENEAYLSPAMQLELESMILEIQ